MKKTLTSLLTFALTLTFITSSLAYAKPGREYYISKGEPAYENSVTHKTKNDIIIIGTTETGTEKTTENSTFESTTAEITTEETTVTTTSETTEITTEETTITTETTTEETTEKTTEETTETTTEETTEETTESTTEETTETTTLSETTTESEDTEDDGYTGGNGGNYADIDDELNIEIHDSNIGTLNINKTTNNTINQTTKEGDTYVTVINEAAPESETTETSLSQDTYNIYMDNSVTYNMPQYISLSIGSSNMSVDGNSKYLDVSPYIQASTSSTMLPLRGIAEAIPGAQVDWDAGTKTALISYNNKSIYFPINTAHYIDTEEGIIPNANNAVTEINSSRTFLPLRTIAQAFSFDVDWDGTTKTVTLLS